MSSLWVNLLVCHFCLLVLAKEGDWTCGADGYWYDNGVRTDYSDCHGGDKGTNKDGGDSSEDKDLGKDGKGGGCTVTSDSGMPNSLDRTCITHPSNSEGRCWWTYVPQAVAAATDGRKFPLVVDMHGGGGCASHQYAGSGFKTLADSEAAKAGGGMVVVWPQGGSGGLWASHGTSTRRTASSADSKSLPQWDDIDFLEKLIAYMLKRSPHMESIDSDRIYLSGFSLGCMMSHRFSMERSKIIAAFGCHGGELSFFPTSEAEMDEDKMTYSIQAMPAYLTIGEMDSWLPGAQSSWEAWTYWNGCARNATNHLNSELVEHVASSCMSYTPTLQTVMLVIQGGPHLPDTRATEKSWLFMRQYKRSGVLAQLPEAPSALPASTASSAGLRLPTFCAVVLAGFSSATRLGV